MIRKYYCWRCSSRTGELLPAEQRFPGILYRLPRLHHGSFRGDFDHDGFPDPVLSKTLHLSAQRGMMLVRNAGGGQFFPRGKNGRIIFHTLADIDADGDQDIRASETHGCFAWK